MVTNTVKTRKAWKLLEVLNWTADHLAPKGFDNPRLNAELLLCHTLGLRRLDLYLEYDRPLTQTELDCFKAALKKRLEHVPIQYITGKVEFMSLPFTVNPSVPIPRPETELLVETVVGRFKDLSAVAQVSRREEVAVADIGTGCGAVAVSLACQIENISIYATDISAEAIKVARQNAVSNGVAEKITFSQGDLLDPLAHLSGGLDAIVSNPPYIRHKDLALLPREIRDYEPLSALDGGPDGLFFHRKLISKSPALLKNGGILALEVGDGQAGEVSQLLEGNTAFKEIRRIRDLNGVERVILAERNRGIRG